MDKTQGVSLAPVKGNNSEYIIRDSAGITMGRIFIVELSKENKYCSFRLKFYRKEGDAYRLLKEALRLILGILFKNMDVFKISTILDEDINTRALTELGYQLEGLIPNSIIVNNHFRHELLLGIDRDIYEASVIKKNVMLRGRRIELRLLTPENANELSEYYNRNSEHLKHYEPARDQSFYTVEVQRKDLVENYRQFLNGVSVNLGIFKENKFIGKIKINNIVLGVFKNAFVGYSMDKDEQGKGYMKEALKLVLDYAFNDLDLHRIEATTLVDNIKSQAVLLNCGFKEIGTSEKYLFIDGKWRDHKIFCKLNNEV